MSLEKDTLRVEECIRIFGYGSLIWKPNFEYDEKYLGFIEGYERRFWQGNTHHRGTPDKPGRVLTLTQVENGQCWGVVYEITGRNKIETALSHLNHREKCLGGYEIVRIPVNVNATHDNIHGNQQVLTARVYYATPENDLFLGAPICINNMAEDIATTRGICGFNSEYLLRVSDFMRAQVPHVDEPHLFKLDALVRKRLGLAADNTLPWPKLINELSFGKTLGRMAKDTDCQNKTRLDDTCN